MDITNPKGVYTFETHRREPGALEVVSFTGQEAVSKLYSFDVIVSEPIEQADSFEQDALGRPARLLARGVEEVRAVRGIVRAVAVLDAHRVKHRWSLRHRLPTRVYCVQHQESDLHFIRCILAEEGVFFFFQWPSPAASLCEDEDLVLADHADAYRAVAGDPVLPFRDPDRMDAHEEFIASFRAKGAVRTGAVKLQEFEFRHPLPAPSG